MPNITTLTSEKIAAALEIPASIAEEKLLGKRRWYLDEIATLIGIFRAEGVEEPLEVIFKDYLAQ